jgi:hypothetical protein
MLGRCCELGLLKKPVTIPQNIAASLNFPKISSCAHGEVNLVFRGGSLDLSLLDKTIPTYFVNFKYFDDMHSFENAYLLTSDVGVIRSYLGLSGERKNFPLAKNKNIIFLYRGSIEEAWCDIIGKPELNNTALCNKLSDKIHISAGTSHIGNLGDGSTNAVLYCKNNTAKLNIFGWDYYMKKEFRESQFVFLSLIRISLGGLFVDRASVRTFLAAKLFNFLLCYRLMNDNNMEIGLSLQGHMRGVGGSHKLIRYLNTTIFPSQESTNQGGDY